MVDNFGVDRPSAASEEQTEIHDNSQDAPPFVFPHGATSATDGAGAQSQASPGSGSLDGVHDKETHWFVSEQSKGDAQETGNAQAMQGTSPFITCIGDIDQSAHCMVDVLWIAARRFRGDTWGWSDSNFFVNATPDPDSTIGQWISYDRGEKRYTNWLEMVNEFEETYQEQRRQNTDIHGHVGGTYLNWSVDMAQRCLNVLASLDITM